MKDPELRRSFSSIIAQRYASDYARDHMYDTLLKQLAAETKRQEILTAFVYHVSYIGKNRIMIHGKYVRK